MGMVIKEDEKGNRYPVFVEDEQSNITEEVAPTVHLREFHKIDMKTGERLDVLLFDLKNDEIPEDCKLGWGEGFHNPKWDFELDTWVEGKPKEEILNLYRVDKDAELNKACSDAILQGFEHTINGLTYFFSYDREAQINFGDSRALLSDGTLAAIPWTVKLNGVYTRIQIDVAEMNKLTLTILNHKGGNIAKYRDVLLPMVNEAKSIEEIQAITWDSK